MAVRLFQAFIGHNTHPQPHTNPYRLTHSPQIPQTPTLIAHAHIPTSNTTQNNQVAVRLLQAFIASRHPSAHKLHLLHKKGKGGGKEKEKNKKAKKAVRFFPPLTLWVLSLALAPCHHIISDRIVGDSRMHFPYRLQGRGRPRRRGGDSSSSDDDDDSSGSSDSDGSSSGDSDDESSSDDDSGSEGGKQHRRRRQKRKRKRGAASSSSSEEEEEEGSGSSSDGSDEVDDDDDDDDDDAAASPLSPPLTGAEGFPFDAADDGNDGHGGVPRVLAAYLLRARRLPRGDVRGGFGLGGLCVWVDGGKDGRLVVVVLLCL